MKFNVANDLCARFQITSVYSSKGQSLSFSVFQTEVYERSLLNNFQQVVHVFSVQASHISIPSPSPTFQSPNNIQQVYVHV